MGLRSEVASLAGQVARFQDVQLGQDKVINLLAKENQRIREDNRRLVGQLNKLFDRLMARNFESYANYRGDPEEANPFTSIDSPYEQIEDEQNIGEVVEDETTGRK